MQLMTNYMAEYLGETPDSTYYTDNRDHYI